MNSAIRTLFLIVGIIGVQITCLNAQEKKSTPAQLAPKVDRDSMMEKIFTRLKLTAEQKEKVKKVFEERHDKVQALLKDSSTSQEEKRKSFKEIVDAGNAEIVKVLTPEQQEIWKQIREENSRSVRSAEENKKKE